MLEASDLDRAQAALCQTGTIWLLNALQGRRRFETRTGPTTRDFGRNHGIEIRNATCLPPGSRLEKILST
jgi:hypothetical protein